MTNIKKALIILVICFHPSMGFGLSVIPGAPGYGMDWGGQSYTNVYKVTNTNSSGSGSLLQAITDHNATDGNNVIVFETSGTIEMTSSWSITKPYLIIAGQTAPSPGIEIKTDDTVREFGIYASYILIQHIRFRPGDEICPTLATDHRSLLVNDYGTNGVTNIVLDHCSFSWAIDELLTLWTYYPNSVQMQDITIRHCIVAWPLHDSCHSGGYPHGYNTIIGQPAANANGAKNILYHANLLAMGHERMPMTRAEEMLVVNNLMYGWCNRAFHCQGQSGFSSTTQKYSIVGNYFLKDDDIHTAYGLGAKKPIWTYGIGEEDNQLYTGSEIYINDNYCPGYDPCHEYSTGSDPFDAGGSDPISWPTGLSDQLKAGDSIKEWILAHAGARPSDRDRVDSDIIAHVYNEDGSIINCVEYDSENPSCDGAGEYAYTTRPTLTANTRSLTVPENPNDDDDEDGYTNLEEWLHGYLGMVESFISSLGASGSVSLGGSGSISLTAP